MNEGTTIGVDLAKEVIVACIGDASGRPAATRQFTFAGFGRWAATLPRSTFGLEACSSAHHWARWLTERGHIVKLMAPEHVKPFRLSRAAKNDANDARAVLTALCQPTMRFVAVKSAESQAMLAAHAFRRGYALERTALVNRTRGLLGEFGVWLPRTPQRFERELVARLDDAHLPERLCRLLREVREQLAAIDARISSCDAEIAAHAKSDDAAQRVQAISGVGPVTASAIVASVVNARDFRNGRQFAAWLGLVPRQSSSGGKSRLGRITKRGDSYIRGLLTLGARSTMIVALKKPPDKRTRLQQWIADLHARAGHHKTMVAIANKHARMLWAILAHGEDYDANAWQRRHTSLVAA